MPISPDFSAAHTLEVRVYYEDTDLAGIVYHANYLRFFERARTEYLRHLGIDQTELAAQGDGVYFAVRSMDIDFLAPAKFDDVLHVQSMPLGMSGARGTIDQRILLADKGAGERVLCTARVGVACLTGKGRPTRIPALARAAFPPA